MTEFTPFASAFGGALIGLSAVMLMAFNGRIAGVSGISVAVLPPWVQDMRRGLADDDALWRLAFVVGLLVAPVGYQFAGGTIEQTVSSDAILMICAGLITGFGAVFGGGCTSGHGVCGMSRLSVRSIIATATFMATALITVFVTRHVIGG
ncbi:MAG: YeeE/YedE family protein [Ahrensia sp.]|nr:YeeE/YedE family protein [Ahrensia sp.]